jgi:hypothetical protein
VVALLLLAALPFAITSFLSALYSGTSAANLSSRTRLSDSSSCKSSSSWSARRRGARARARARGLGWGGSQGQGGWGGVGERHEVHKRALWISIAYERLP